ncbi:MAG: Lrp/AsnC family transcriptional regulator [Nitrospiraceae bacterium]|jgi:DNA-binding Lrp family transcriptional regulator|nr:Lrp/AsnC family transcriptional regulator [Nitrospiraceae bacterium]
MVTAIVLLNVQRDKVNAIAEQLAEVDVISEIYSVAGGYDLAAIVRARSNEELADVVTNRLLKVSGILKSETLIAFRTYSRHDLEAMFNIGMEKTT